ncbi:DUF2384 domain-containing protein [Marinilabiliaceae bacterium JC017]|nr:DUF2384 domain-containing protein [Marinilabiliaceae bacterium JC017]
MKATRKTKGISAIGQKYPDPSTIQSQAGDKKKSILEAFLDKTQAHEGVEEPLSISYSNGLKWTIVEALQEEVDSSDFNILWNFAAEIGINKTEYAKYLHVTTRTLDRNLNERYTLSVDKSEKALRLFEMMQHGIKVFGSHKKFSLWIREYNTALGRKPVELFTTIAGIDIINNTLIRIEHGVFA